MKKTDISCIFLLLLSAFFFICEPLEAEGKTRYHVPKINDIPVNKGVSLHVPKILGNVKLALMGLVDVTAKPFLADPSGIKDSTTALQRAVNFARDYQMVAYFPQGTYLVSNTIECRQDYKKLEIEKYPNDKHVFFARKFPNVLIGSRKGQRPKIILAPNSLGYQETSNPKPVIHFYAWRDKGPNESPLSPGISQNQMFINIDIIIGKGNPGAVGIRHRGAEGSGVQECTIDATNGMIGLQGGCGSGGSHAAITVIGGEIGLDLRQTQPAPTITGITLINQTKTAILYGGRQSLSAVGLKIVSQVMGPIIESSGWIGPHHGQMALVDCQIICNNPEATAISSKHSLYLKNVYIYSGDKAVQVGSSLEIEGSYGCWLHIKEYAKGVSPHKWHDCQFKAPIYINGTRTDKQVKDIEQNIPPPDDLQSRHLWNYNSFPHFESKKIVNVKMPPYNAMGDGKQDDTEAIQKAIEQNEKILLPKGYYKITRTIQLLPHTKIIGVAKHLSVLLVTDASGDFCSPSVPKPIIRSAPDKTAETILAFFEIFVPIKYTGAFALDWRSGCNSIIRDVSFRYGELKNFKVHKNKFRINHPLVLVEGNGGGKWYNFDSGSHKFQGANYRHLLIHNNKMPLSIYQCAPQHASSEANMEIHNSANVSIFGMKGESNGSLMLKIKNSNNINLYGYGGNARAKKNRSLFYIENCNNITLANLVDTPFFLLNKGQTKFWFMVIEKKAKNNYHSLYFDRPVLYKTFERVPINLRINNFTGL